MKDYLLGVFAATFCQMAFQDFMGLEGYVQYVRANWVELPFAVPATLTMLVIGYYCWSSRKPMP